jgi:Holliday junction resolvase RusA-like endonuclease
MNQSYEVWLEKPPSVNHMYFDMPIKTKAGKTFVSKIPTSDLKAFKGQDNKKFGHIPGTAQMAFKKAGIKPFSGKFKVVMEAVAIWPDKRKRDMNNYSKAIIDAFKECGYVPDDNIILWREMDYWIEKGITGFKLKIYESELVA